MLLAAGAFGFQRRKRA
ncbi:MprA protease, GlyGly-CTERM protein-sorting domain-containing form [Ralstonia solanacearum]